LVDERLEHLSLFNLIGDPLMRFQHPAEVQLESESQLVAGQRVRVTGHCEITGQGLVELVCRRDRSRVPAPDRTRFLPTHAFLESFNEVYRQANDPVWNAEVFSPAGGDFEIVLEIPPEARGPCHLRAFVAGQHQFAVGARDVFVRRPLATERQEDGLTIP
jgi:hypothetical protein